MGKVGNSWARSEIRGQDRKFVGKVWGPTLTTNFRPCPRISDLAHEFPTLPTNYRPCPRIARPCPRIAGPCPRISDLAHEFPTLPTNFRPCPRISDRFPRISDLPPNFPTLPTNFPTLPTNFRPCPQIQQIVLPSFGGSFWPTFGRNKSYCRVLVALSGPRLAVTNRTAESWWLFLAHVWP